MLKRTLATLMTVIMMLGVSFTVNANQSIGADKEETFSAKDYTSSSGAVTTDESYVYVPAGASVSYDLNVEKAADYRVSLMIRTDEETAAEDVAVTVGETVKAKNLNSGMGKRHLGVFALAKGSNTLKIEAKTAIVMEWVYLSCTEKSVAAEGVTKINSVDFYDTDIPIGVYMDNQWYYVSSDNTVTGCLTYPGNGQWAAYTLNAEQSGIYDITLITKGIVSKNVFSVTDETGKDLAVGTTDAEKNQVTLTDVPLNKGVNKIRVKAKGGLYTSPSEWNTVEVYYMNVERTGDKIASNEETYFSAKSYIESTGEVEKDSDPNSNYIYIPAGGSVSYKLNIEKTADYRVSLLARGNGAAAETTITVGNSTKVKNLPAGGGKYHFGVHSVNEGDVTLKIEAKSAIAVEWIYLSIAEKYIKSTGVTKISATDFCATDINIEGFMDNQWYYGSPDGAATGCIVYPGNGQYTEYILNTAKSGLYNITLMTNGQKAKNVFAILDENGIELASVNADEENKRFAFTNVQLKKGINKIRIKSQSGMYISPEEWNYVEFYYMNVERTGDIGAQEISSTDETAVNITSYSTATDGISVSDAAVSLTANGEVTYTVKTAKAGKYKMRIAVKNQNSVMPANISVNGGETAAISFKNDQASAYRTVGRFDFAEGDNTIKITAGADGLVFDKITVKCVERDVAASGKTVIEAEDYNTVDFNESVYVDDIWYYTFHDNVGPIRYPGNGQTATYILNVAESGYYQIVMHTWEQQAKNTFTVKDSNDNVLGSAYADMNSNTVTIKNIELKAGRNEIKIMANGLYTSAEEWNMVYVSHLTVEKLARTVIDTEAYIEASSYESVSGNVSVENEYITAQNGAVINYVVNAKNAGTYKMLVKGQGSDGYAEITSGETYFETDYFDDETGYRSAGQYSFTAGENVIKLEIFDGDVNIYGILLKNIDNNISATEKTKVEAEDYTEVSFMESAYVDKYIDSEAFENKGCIEFTTNLSYAKYTVNAVKSASYNVTLYASGMADKNSFTLYDGNNNIIAVGKKDISAGTVTFENVNLKAGSNVLMVEVNGVYTSASDKNSVYAYYMEFTPKTIEFALYSGSVADENKITSLTNGNIVARAALNGKFAGKSVFFAAALYKTDETGTSKLADIKTDYTESASETTVFEKTIENVDITDGTYSFKIFAWSDMDGGYIEYAE